MKMKIDTAELETNEKGVQLHVLDDHEITLISGASTLPVIKWPKWLPIIVIDLGPDHNQLCH